MVKLQPSLGTWAAKIMHDETWELNIQVQFPIIKLRLLYLDIGHSLLDIDY